MGLVICHGSFLLYLYRFSLARSLHIGDNRPQIVFQVLVGCPLSLSKTSVFCLKAINLSHLGKYTLSYKVSRRFPTIIYRSKKWTMEQSKWSTIILILAFSSFHSSFSSRSNGTLCLFLHVFNSDQSKLSPFPDRVLSTPKMGFLNKFPFFFFNKEERICSQ